VFDHVTLRVSDRGASRLFYETVLAPLGHELTNPGVHYLEWSDFGIAEASADNPATHGLHVAFTTRSPDEVDAFWRAGLEAGYQSDGEPGLRPEYHEQYYGGFLVDPDGNSAEAVWHGRPREGENVLDHLWIRVADLEASKRFYETVAPTLGLGVRLSAAAQRVYVEGDDRHFALLEGEPTEHVHLAFPAPDDATVAEFHRIALRVGYVDNGGPAERAHYHPGYYAAFVLDPDGNNVEAVNHNR
jgi:catechol 2,3-dioxygenase-like lactoylglutathione lyase family enzyme